MGFKMLRYLQSKARNQKNLVNARELKLVRNMMKNVKLTDLGKLVFDQLVEKHLKKFHRTEDTIKKLRWEAKDEDEKESAIIWKQLNDSKSQLHKECFFGGKVFYSFRSNFHESFAEFSMSSLIYLHPTLSIDYVCLLCLQ
jgi:hypothetical protein